MSWLTTVDIFIEDYTSYWSSPDDMLHTMAYHCRYIHWRLYQLLIITWWVSMPRFFKADILIKDYTSYWSSSPDVTRHTMAYHCRHIFIRYNKPLIISRWVIMPWLFKADTLIKDYTSYWSSPDDTLHTMAYHCWYIHWRLYQLLIITRSVSMPRFFKADILIKDYTSYWSSSPDVTRHTMAYHCRHIFIRYNKPLIISRWVIMSWLITVDIFIEDYTSYWSSPDDTLHTMAYHCWYTHKRLYQLLIITRW